MKHATILFILGAFIAIQLPSFEAEAKRRPIRKTQARQMKRIKNGVKNGSLTRRETRKLVKQQRKVNRTRRQALADDGRIDRKEALQIRKKQAKASFQIFKQKHDRQTQD